MKKCLSLFVVLFTLLIIGNASAQDSKYGWLAQDSWAVGFGGTYPRLVSTNLNVVEGPQSYGGFISIQRNFSEHVGLRLKGKYLNIEGHVGSPKGALIQNKVIGGDVEVLYYFAPVEPISPYLTFGAGGFAHKSDGSPVASLNDYDTDYSVILGFGAEWTIATDWKIKTEFGYHSIASSGFDGVFGTNGNGILGTNNDSYMNFDLGLVYYFEKGEKSKLNDLYTGISPDIDYNKIEDIVRKYQTPPTEVDYNRIEDIVKKHKSVAVGGDNWVLVGVNFDFNKAALTKESMPVLYNAAQILLTHPNLRVEIQGYTDNVGPEKYNQKLSLERAETVKRFLVAKGVEASRLSTTGFGEANPISDNKTAEGRALNRRIEFKVLSK